MSISAGLGAVLPPVGYGFRNVIFNGNFMVNQRGYTSGTNLASGSYGFDRWKSNYTNTALTFTSAPQGQTVTISASGVIRQIIEQANVAVGPYVLSWRGSAVGRVYNDGATAPAYSSSPLSVTLDGSANVIVEFTPSSGTATLGEVQLEKGQRQTPFEYRPVSIELALCQRYYAQLSGSQAYPIYTRGVDARPNVIISLPVPLRASPSLNLTGTAYATTYWSNVSTISGIGLTSWEINQVVAYFSTFSGLSAGTIYMYGGSSATLTISSEL